MTIRNYIFIGIFTLFTSCKDEIINHEEVLITSDVIFCSADFDKKATNIYMVNHTGENIKNITNAEWGEFAATAISKNGDYLLFYQADPSYGIDIGMDIYIYNIKEDIIVGPITNGTPGNFSPDGQKFTFARHTYDENGGYSSIYLYDLIQHTEKKLTPDGFHCFNPQISPDGMNICFQTAKFYQWDSISACQLHLMSIEGKNIVDLTELKDNYYASNGVFTQDGNSIICDYRINTSLPSNIVQIDLLTKELKYITENRNDQSIQRSNFRDPSLSTETNRIYFYIYEYDYSLAKFKKEVWVVNKDGSGLKSFKKHNDFWVSHPIAGRVSYYPRLSPTTP